MSKAQYFLASLLWYLDAGCTLLEWGLGIAFLLVMAPILLIGDVVVPDRTMRFYARYGAWFDDVADRFESLWVYEQPGAGDLVQFPDVFPDVFPENSTENSDQRSSGKPPCEFPVD